MVKKLTKSKWLKQRVEHIPNDGIYKIVKTPRERVFARQGLTADEIQEYYLLYAWSK